MFASLNNQDRCGRGHSSSVFRIRSRLGFSRLELVVVTAIISFLCGLSVSYLRGLSLKSKATVCRENLRQLSLGMLLYINESDGRLPYASLVQNTRSQSTWDTLVSPAVRSQLKSPDPNVAAPPQSKVNELLLCPADRVKPADWAAKYKLRRRTYAMPQHDMRQANWPPGPDNATGVGLWWSFGSKGTNQPSSLIYNAEEPTKQASVRTGMILQPKATILLAEQAKTNNIVANGQGSTINCAADHLDTALLPLKNYHQGKFNYLMVDGHVEFLSPDQTVGATGEAGDNPRKHLGMWTIRAKD
ncbi:MAG: hypothetical protein EB141_05285 [Verrucomicrobia bacterium]|nr:hypothetical protein [Verrucomicrobiota bacterium]NBU10416.1 hypothetical protein [Pseudomonadota bacterium]NDA65590.1 hypothetical protein [Verrucomicrobiota bacterium]NDB75049.1 hypothetical protein [Verrucomicrobiota bacterium]NDD37431.1 hypothetical protein [Verrucomicrobiota bacterium]